ncbi:MAG: thermonuclease family protein [Patescibacteria group bacterium]|nr:thermonuclease family protein [Patescibacteria group bacterium]
MIKKIIPYTIALITLILGFFSGNYYSNQKQSQVITQGKVIRVIDGDNLELDNAKSVRLYGINCPEKDQKFSQEAIDLSTKLTLNNQIRLDYQPNYQTDRWNRTLAYVFINDTFLNEQLVRQGLCEVTIYKKRAKLKYQDQLLEAQIQAKQDKLGRWE